MSKRIFVSCSVEDEQTRTLFSSILHNRAVSHYSSNMPALQLLNEDYKANCRATIKASHGVIALISAHQYAQRELWEINCAHEENIPLIGFYINGATSINKPVAMGDVLCKNWTWDNVNEFIDSL